MLKDEIIKIMYNDFIDFKDNPRQRDNEWNLADLSDKILSLIRERLPKEKDDISEMIQNSEGAFMPEEREIGEEIGYNQYRREALSLLK